MSRDGFAALREAFVEAILEPLELEHSAVLDAFATVPRHLYLPVGAAVFAYEALSVALPWDQRATHPVALARMLDLAAIRPGERVLWIGLGSGYGAALAHALGGRVVGLESIEGLAQRARAVLVADGRADVEVHAVDGTEGFPADAPYDVILASVALVGIPPAWLTQLGPGGRLVLPLGVGTQVLVRVHRGPDGDVLTRHDEVAMSPLQRTPPCPPPRVP